MASRARDLNKLATIIFRALEFAVSVFGTQCLLSQSYDSEMGEAQLSDSGGKDPNRAANGLACVYLASCLLIRLLLI